MSVLTPRTRGGGISRPANEQHAHGAEDNKKLTTPDSSPPRRRGHPADDVVVHAVEQAVSPVEVELKHGVGAVSSSG